MVVHVQQKYISVPKFIRMVHIYVFLISCINQAGLMIWEDWEFCLENVKSMPTYYINIFYFKILGFFLSFCKKKNTVN